jgi:hypothetical protein
MYSDDEKRELAAKIRNDLIDLKDAILRKNPGINDEDLKSLMMQYIADGFEYHKDEIIEKIQALKEDVKSLHVLHNAANTKGLH